MPPQEARLLYQRALTIREQEYGSHHVKTVETRACLIALLYTLGQQEEAAPLEAIQAVP